jgi:hypothetical protein
MIMAIGAAIKYNSGGNIIALAENFAASEQENNGVKTLNFTIGPHHNSIR